MSAAASGEGGSAAQILAQFRARKDQRALDAVAGRSRPKAEPEPQDSNACGPTRGRKGCTSGHRR